MITVYHGGTEIIKQPVCRFGRPNLDFGQGFYVTDVKEQAIQWAVRMSERRGMTPLLNRYNLDRDAILSIGRCKIFSAYDADWLEFIIACRQGTDPSKEYDYIEGGVANDRVIDTVNLYILGLMDLNTALGRLSEHRPNNQMCLLNQALTDKYLEYDSTETI